MTLHAKQLLEPRHDPARVEREWNAIRARRTTRRARRISPAAIVALAAALALAVGLEVIHRPPAPRPVVDAWLESAEEARPRITLEDGTAVDLDPSTRAHFVAVNPGEARIDLERGGIRIDEGAGQTRRFVVRGDGYEARGRGSAFVVRRIALGLAFGIDVRAERGDVEVATPGGDVRSVHAGEAWSPSPGISPEGSPSSPGAQAAPSAATEAITATPRTTAPAPAAVSSSPPSDRAKALFEEAEREGHTPAESARLFDKLRRTYRRDPRAGLSAFELGRLRLDALGDPRGAEEAFRDAIVLAPTSPFREDAEARRVEALARLGDHGACVAASKSYLARYPAGAYRKAVSMYCGDR